MDSPALVGVVLLSHSRRLAEGAAELAVLVAGPDVRIAAVGGTDDGELGTSFDALADAIERVARGRGVVVIPDLGSSVLTVRTYLDEGDGRRAEVVIADAPFVEGAVAAAVAAATGHTLEGVVGEAEAARDVRKL